MKQTFLITLFLCVFLFASSQTKYKPGYFIDNNNNKVACLIKDVNTQNNPSKFRYRLNDESITHEAVIDSIKEFRIDNKSKYVRHLVKMDMTGYDWRDLTFSRDPEFETKTLFLEVVLEGKASLFSYIDAPMERFFYSVNDSTVSQLVYREFRVRDHKTQKNKYYLNQLMDDLKCKAISFDDVNCLEYSDKDLSKVFVKYNKFHNPEYEYVKKTKKQKGTFKISIRPGGSYSSVWVNNNQINKYEVDFGKIWIPRVGLEFEYVFPFHNNKWSILFEPNITYYSGESPVILGNAKIEYKRLELPIGIRRYLFLSDKSKLYVNASFVNNLPINSYVEFDAYRRLDIISKGAFNGGIGFNRNNRYNIEIIYGSFNDYTEGVAWSSKYDYFSIVFGYTIFKRN